MHATCPAHLRPWDAQHNNNGEEHKSKINLNYM
jgi:hypothetical protein